MALPAALVCNALQWTRLSLAWQERQTAFFGVIVALAYTALAMAARRDIETCFFGGLLLLVLLDVIAGAFSVGMSGAFAAAIAGIFAMGHPYLAGVSRQDGGVAEAARAGGPQRSAGGTGAA
jgi:hypothetical protein